MINANETEKLQDVHAHAADIQRRILNAALAEVMGIGRWEDVLRSAEKIATLAKQEIERKRADL